MKPLTIRPANKICGRIALPGDKSISHRAVMLGAIARGQTRVRGLLDCDDCNRTIDAFRKMGVAINAERGETVISGAGLRGLRKPDGVISVGESGTTMRVLPGILAGQDFESVLDGDESLSRRPMQRLVEPLSLMGVDIRARDGGYPPLTIRGGTVKAIDHTMRVSSAQVKSAILFAALYADGTTTVEEVSRSRDHTERMMDRFGAGLKVEGKKISVVGGKELTGCPIEVPGDISSASFFMVAALLLDGSNVRIDKACTNPTRAGILGILLRMGARYRIMNASNAFEPYADIEIESGKTAGTVIEPLEIPAIIDELPILFVLAALSRGSTVIKGAAELRVKETDRIASMKENIEKMGGRVEVKDDEITIAGVGRLKGASLKSFGDHRTCMAMTVASLAADSPSSIDDTGCVAKSFPGFFKALDTLRK